MKVKELIEELQKFENQDATVELVISDHRETHFDIYSRVLELGNSKSKDITVLKYCIIEGI